MIGSCLSKFDCKVESKMKTSSASSNDRISRHLPTIGLDYEAAKSFLDNLHAGEILTFQMVPGADCDLKAKIVHGYLDDLWDQLVDWNLKGADIYCMVNRGDGKGRKAWNVTALTAFFVSTHDQPIERIISLPVRPHIIVQIGPASFQAYWKVVPDPITKGNRWQKAEIFRQVQSHLAATVGGDPNLTDLARVTHVPGFFTYKRKPYQVGLSANLGSDDFISEFNTIFP